MKKVICSMIVVVSVFVYGFALAAPNNPPSAPVTVVNTNSNPVPVNVINSAMSEPIHHDLASGDFTVPTDRILIIKYVSGYCYMTEGYFIKYFALVTGPTENRMRNYVVPVLIGAKSGDDFFNISQETYIYAPPGSTVNYTWATTNPSLYFDHLVIVGDLVPIP